MANIVILNGPFGSGKTDLKNELIQKITKLQPELPIFTLEDGPILVDQIRDIAHGTNWSRDSASHQHSWTQTEHNHLNLLPESHFPFTVLDKSVSENMFSRYLDQMRSYQNNPGLLIAELGTGKANKVFGNPDFSTRKFLQKAAKKNYWGRLKQHFSSIIAVGAEWESRLKYNPSRPAVADGISSSWELMESAMRITYESDFDSWKSQFPPDIIIYYRNLYNGFDENQLNELTKMILNRNRSLLEGRNSGYKEI
ncbi:hypothetical protein A2774_05805 [Candidatus Roizmanbacteria bacterium RIFCSPHIGHO2_01_FULL_39_12c]|uniref:Uncharacterized protein n=1 Tax=Candidatus Roizmanbacteria bacterium RIFCSPHIGHO2_01_FULL_39_12c TaxID=1802031 RepID=A0A1F7GCD3_9BACT|nr:MAG: hypothetical protein A2774_05805 [Candidatus Roizmanbacteria bacterium RIFCSPHIGHO2_01_FULL_39_12c]OGK47765.1 MAG: hypothetical protein A2963_02815 [Candidatus Roizmanbacteria bacterium RIFCSPLOWO2_01_FULL_40_13]